MKVERHVYLLIFASFLGAAVGFFGLGFAILIYLAPPMPEWARFLVLATFGIIGMKLAKMLVSHGLPARCPECGGPSKPSKTKDRQIRYRCTKCDYVVETGIVEGNSDADPSL